MHLHSTTPPRFMNQSKNDYKHNSTIKNRVKERINLCFVLEANSI